MSKQNFSRINVDVNSLNVSAPGRSGFDLTKSSMQSVPFGKLYPVRCTKVMPTSTVKGSVVPDLQLEKFATPMAGRMRMDTHTFMVASKRINKDWHQYIESGAVGHTALNAPSFKVFENLCHYISGLNNHVLIEDLGALLQSFYPAGVLYANPNWNPSYAYVKLLNYFKEKCKGYADDPSTLPTYLKNVVDFFAVEADRLGDLVKTYTNLRDTNFPNLDAHLDMDKSTEEGDMTGYALTETNYYLGDFVYDLVVTLFGEGSVLDQLGYPIYNYYGSLRERLNRIDRRCRLWTLYLNLPGQGDTYDSWTWTSDILSDYFTKIAYSFRELFNFKDYNYEDDEFVKMDPDNYYWDISVSEYPLRANYAVWFDYFRDWHLDPETSCPNPDDFANTSLLFYNTVYTQSQWSYLVSLLMVRYRNWSRDGFTMVQLDDVYRHVYAPATVTNDASEMVSYTDSGFDTYYFSVNAGASGTISLPFPSSFTNLFGTVTTENAYYHDLQTMRRAEMLKRKLTRDYYNPDNYVGQFVARWGVEPADFAIRCTQYLGGNETMISGSQVTANMQTSDTVLGQRTLVADAKSSDSFLYNFGEYGYLISYVSILPLPHYDALNTSLLELSVHDEIIPEYANDNQVMIRTCDLVRDFVESGVNVGLGYVARYYGYRMALDDCHGKFLREYRSYSWLRDKTTSNYSMLIKDAVNAHVRVPLDCFIGLHEWNTVAFGNIQLPLFVECPLPDKLENV